MSMGSEIGPGFKSQLYHLFSCVNLRKLPIFLCFRVISLLLHRVICGINAPIYEKNLEQYMAQNKNLITVCYYYPCCHYYLFSARHFTVYFISNKVNYRDNISYLIFLLLRTHM